MTPRFLHVPIFLTLVNLAGAADATPPKLAVVISVDQLRADYLVRVRPYFGEGGFKRLLEGGTEFRNAHYRHAITQTAPGHAQMLSGVFSNVHGIIGNEWLDRASWEQVNSVEDRDAPLVGIAPAELGPVQAKAPETTGRSPKNLLAATVGDQLKLRDGAKAKVFTASNKDRSAILLGGQRGDAAYWDENGKFVTSRHYRAALPAWVAAFNAEKRAEAAFGRVWERVLAPAVYETVQGPDDAAGETVDFGFTRVFPKTVNGGAAAVTPKFFTAYENSPFSTEALGEFVQRAVVEEQLGRHEGTDLLGVSFSQIDAIGHSYGPASHEVMDSMLRLDRVLAALFDRIDREVGLARCVIVLTADHGVAPLPEGFKDGRGGRIKVAELDAAVKQALDAKFGALPKGETWFARDNLAYHLRPAALAARSASAKDAGVVVKTALMATPVVAEAFTREEILAAEPAGDSVLALVRRSYHAERGRDVILVPKPYFMVKTSSGSTHSTPYDYDTHVALVFFGAGVPQGVQEGRVGIDDLAPTLAPLLGVKAPPLAQGRKLF
jgi:predicted AlkP superfamily pyrophosphatase or phosphodiesterase